MTGCNAFINSEGYIRQFPHPLVIYSLRSTLRAGQFGARHCRPSGLGHVVAPGKPAGGHSLIPIALLCYFMIAGSVQSLAAFFGTRYRDLPQFLIIALQAIW
jgi:lipopolysaccharide transport system permease protein